MKSGSDTRAGVGTPRPAAENYACYAADAERSGDQELVEFFREMQQTGSQLSQRILGLLKDRLDRT